MSASAGVAAGAAALACTEDDDEKAEEHEDENEEERRGLRTDSDDTAGLWMRDEIVKGTLRMHPDA